MFILENVFLDDKDMDSADYNKDFVHNESEGEEEKEEMSGTEHRPEASTQAHSKKKTISILNSGK